MTRQVHRLRIRGDGKCIGGPKQERGVRETAAVPRGVLDLSVEATASSSMA